MKQDSEKSGARSAIILAATVIAVAILSVLFGLQTLVWLNTRHWASVDPWLSDTPKSLPASDSSLPGGSLPLPPELKGTSAKAAKPAQLKAYDYEFTSPWPGNVKTVPELSFVRFRFDSGQVIVFFDPEAQINVIRQMKSGETVQYTQFQNVFGELAPATNYDLYRTVYSATPAQISPTMHSQDAFRTNVLLLWKLSFGFDMQPGIHSIEAGNNRGFEFGDLASGHPVALRVFDETDKQFRFIFTIAVGSNGTLTQDNINLAVQSLKSIPVLER
jgi:hypothetical protein